MAPVGLEWIVIAVLVVVVFLWTPKKLPEFAKALGQAKHEFEKALKGDK